MPTRQRESLIADLYQRHKRQLLSANKFRDQRVVHREITATDVRVLDHNAHWLLPFARTALRASGTAWDAAKAIGAVAHSILVIAYYVLQRHRAYSDLGPDYLRLRDNAEAYAKRLVRQLERLGHKVSLEPLPVGA